MVASSKTKIPTYRRQRNRNGIDRAFVKIDGERVYLGEYDTDASREEYRRVIAEWLASGSVPDRPAKRNGKTQHTVAELSNRYLKWADRYYVDAHGNPTSSASTAELVLRPVLALYSSLPVSDFTPKCLKAVQAEMVQRGWSRKQINRATTRVRSVFKWAVENGIADAATWQALSAVRGLRRGKTDAKETQPIRPVPTKHVDIVKGRVSRQVAAMIDLQLLTAMRPGEACIMRIKDLDMSGKVWRYTPADHKNAHRDQERVIFIGPQAQAVLAPFLTGRAIDAYLFSPAESDRERRERMTAERTTRAGQGNGVGTNRKRRPKRTPGAVYGVDEYRRAIARACKAAGIDPWSPHRLRHSAATNLRREFGLDVARAVCGHRSIAVTDTYAEIDHEKAAAVIAKVG